MSLENRVSIQLSEEDIDTVSKAIDKIKGVLDQHLKSLTTEERKELPKINDGTIPFVEKAMDYCESNPEFAPPYLQIDEMKIDLTSREQLTGIYRPLGQIASNLQDTIMLAGSESYQAALTYYNSVKQAVKINVAGAKPIYEDLSRRFKRSGSVEESNAPTEEI